MDVQKYVVLLDARHAVAAGERAKAVGRLVGSAAGAAGLVGLTATSLNESLTGPAETIAVVQAWINDSADADAGSVLDGPSRKRCFYVCQVLILGCWRRR